MKRKIFILSVLLGLSIGVYSQESSKTKVAIYVTGEIESVYKDIIGNKLVSYITQSDEYIAVERSSEFQNIIGQEHGFQRNGMVDDLQIVELGKQLGVRYVIGINASKLFNEIYLAVRQLDILTGEIINTVEVSAVVDGRESLQNLSMNACDYLLYDYSKVSVSEGLNKPRDLMNVYWKHCPKGYHMATVEEVKFLIKAYIATGRELKTPIITNVRWGAFHKLDRNYNQCTITFNIIRKDLSMEEDGMESLVVHRKEGYDYDNKTEERYYVYFIKD